MKCLLWSEGLQLCLMVGLFLIAEHVLYGLPYHEEVYVAAAISMSFPLVVLEVMMIGGKTLWSLRFHLVSSLAVGTGMCIFLTTAEALHYAPCNSGACAFPRYWLIPAFVGGLAVGPIVCYPYEPHGRICKTGFSLVATALVAFGILKWLH